MILAGQLLLDDGDGRCTLRPGMVRTDADRIVEVVVGEIPATADVGDATTLITPGFIDTHLHLPQFDIVGAHGMPLLTWLSEATYPAEMRWSDVGYARDATSRAVAQLLSVGTTGICGFATVHDESTRAALEVARDIGMRGVIGQVLMDREAPQTLCRPAEQLLGETSRLVSDFPPGGRMAAAVTPRFAVACTPELLAGAGHLARQHGVVIQSHLAETVGECERVNELFSGASYLDVYRTAGLLGEKSLFGHGIHLDRDDRAALSTDHAIIAHCPVANAFLRSGDMALGALLADGVTVTLGSDIGAGFEKSMVRVAREMIRTAASIGERFPDAAQAWHLITKGNADALGWDDAGRIEEGASADLLAVRPAIAWLDGSVDPLSKLMFAWDDRWIERTMLEGRFV